jgi:RNA polymerase sigma-70 factor (ECF subfamily)
MSSDDEITKLLVSMRGGDRHGALDELLPLVYGQLRAIASRSLPPGGRDQTLSPTVLVHEAYLKIHDQSSLAVQDRKHFFSVAAIAMRQITIDHARRRLAAKRGGGLVRVDFEMAGLSNESSAEETLALDEALSRLSKLDERMARVVELRFYGGLSVEETAEVLEVDPRTVKRDWRKARAILYAALGGPSGGGPPAGDAE